MAGPYSTSDGRVKGHSESNKSDKLMVAGAQRYKAVK